MATENYVAVIGKPVTRAMVDKWCSVDDMVSVLALEQVQNGVISGNSIKYDEICIDIDCAAVAGIVIIVHEDGEEVPDLRWRQFPINEGAWCERDGKLCLSLCVDIIDDCCDVEPEPEPVLKPWKADWCQRWCELQAKLDKMLEGATTQVSAFGRSKSSQRFEQWMCEKLEQQIREAKNKCLACRGIRQARPIFRRIPRSSFRRS